MLLPSAWILRLSQCAAFVCFAFWILLRVTVCAFPQHSVRWHRGLHQAGQRLLPRRTGAHAERTVWQVWPDCKGGFSLSVGFKPCEYGSDWLCTESQRGILFYSLIHILAAFKLSFTSIQGFNASLEPQPCDCRGTIYSKMYIMNA